MLFLFLRGLPISIALLANSAHSQTVDQEKLVAVMSVINMMLMDQTVEPIDRPEGEGQLISLNQLIPETYTITENLFAEFEKQTSNVELCFIIESSNAVQVSDLRVEVNGEAEPVTLGENCYFLGASQQRTVNYVNLIVTNPGITLSLTTLELSSTQQSQLLLPRLTRGEWDQRAVRKVLKIFAYGGQATDQQIVQWAAMRPEAAIMEMLNFAEHNLKLSAFVANEQYTEIVNQPGTLQAYHDYISSDSSNLPIPTGDQRRVYAVDMYRMEDAFGRFATTRGLNPFRQKIGLWETNYHLAVNLDTEVERDQVVVYYDLIMEAHEAGLPYKDIMGIAAKSAAIATQYGHRFNQWDEDQQICQCNDDFAREIHQLFYGIFGVNDPQHEDGTIRETAKMLTDMNLRYNNGLPNYVTFETDGHHQADLTILGQTISGANASEKIDDLMPISMQHPESLENLPVMIIKVLADDNLNEANKNLLRASWASMGVNRKLLDFIQAYAISNLFHGVSQFKYLTSFDRAFYTANKFNITNTEAYMGNNYIGDSHVGRAIDDVLRDDNSNKVFHPLHNVFGGQTSLEASDSAVAFEKNFNRSAPSEQYGLIREFPVQCNTCNNGSLWSKDWSQLIPDDGGIYRTDNVAEWLWNHVVGSLDNFTSLERAHLYTILGANRVQSNQPWDMYQFFDLNYLLCLREDRIEQGINNNSLSTLMSSNVWDEFCRPGDNGHASYSPIEAQAFNQVLTGQLIEDTPHVQQLLNQLALVPVPLTSSNAEEKRRANERIHAALAFIFATPFVFAEGDL